jgi:penicillin-binding protein 2
VRVYLKSADREWLKRRLIGCMIVASAVFSVLLMRLYHLQIISGSEYRRLSEHNCIRLQTIPPSRGLIYDRNARLLVDNRPSYNLYIVPRDAQPLRATLIKLAGYLDEPVEDLQEAVDKNGRLAAYQPVLLKEDIDRDDLAAIEVGRYKLPGVMIRAEPRRHYIYGDSAAHLIGYLGEISEAELADETAHEGCRPGDLVGKFGIEKSAEPILRGRSGGRQVEVDATGQVVRVLKEVPAEPGLNLYLTIDHALQRKAEILISGVAAAAVAMDPANGQILALASSPAFDPNHFVSGLSRSRWRDLVGDPFRPMENKVVQGEYPPASTYKIVTAMAGLEEGVIDETTRFYCPGFYRLGNRVFRCWKRGGHGHVNVRQALAESCDVFFYNVGQKLGVDRIAEYARRCGLGRPTGIALDREAAGLVPTSEWKRRRFGEPWMGGETLPVAIGQGYDLTTPLQMLVLTAAVANGGALHQPTIVGRIDPADEGEHPGKDAFKPDQAPHRLPVSEENLEIIQDGLWQVVNKVGGTARSSRLKDISVAGKTGTGQVVGRRRGEPEREVPLPAHLRDHAWFVAYAPSEDPRIAVAVMVEHGEHGSGAAAPIARELIRHYLTP